MTEQNPFPKTALTAVPETDYISLADAWQHDEPSFMAVFTQLANRYLVENLAALTDLVSAAELLPLTSSVAHQQILYFRALVQRKAGAHTAAAITFDQLLAQADLEPSLHARALNSRAICHRLLGEPEAALDGYAASLSLWQQLDDPLQSGKVQHNMGIIHYQLQHYAAAQHHLQEAAALFTKAGSIMWLTAARNELGIVYRDLGRWEEALAHLQACATQFRTDGLRDQLGLVLLNMGEIRLFQGEFMMAHALLTEALALIETQAYHVDVFLHLGLLHQAQGNLPAALAAFSQALALAAERRDILPHVHYRLGDCLRLMGDEAAALVQFMAAVSIVEETRQPLNDSDLKISLLGQWQQIYETLVLFYAAHEDVTAAFAWAERARARAFAEAVQPASNIETTAAANEIQVVLAADTAVCCYFTTGVLAQDIPLLRAIPADNPLRTHLLTPAHTFLFVLTNTRLALYDCALDPNRLVMASLRGPQVERFLHEAVLTRLSQSLLTPSSLVQRQLYLIPHGPLHRVPFAALRDEAGRFLGDRMHIAYAPSGTLLLHHIVTDPVTASGLGLALAAGEGERPLPYAQTEAAMVAQLGGGEVFVGSVFTLAETAAQRRWLHFACHAWFNEVEPLASYLEIGAGVRLTAAEVLQNWQLQADLVTLSACHTGISQVVRGDEPLGLVRAFLAAGAGAVLVSLWPVEDVVAFLLMHHFYATLAQGERDLSAALTQAQCWLRQLTTAAAAELLMVLHGSAHHPLLAQLPVDAAPFAHPRYWAAFLIVGRTRLP